MSGLAGRAAAQDTVAKEPDSAAPAVRAAAARDSASSGDRQRAADSIPARPSSLILVNSEAVDALRTSQLGHGIASGQSLLLRSASSLTRPLRKGRQRLGAAALAPQLLIVSNSALPFSQNNGALWAGKGISSRTSFGLRLETSRIRIIVAPEIISAQNDDWVLRQPVYRAPTIPPERSGGGFVFPFYVSTGLSIDQPLRFGDKPIRRLDPGQSSAFVSTDRFEFGFSTENEWWGPGIRNAIVLSNNAPGFPHLFVRTARPLATRFGELELRWLVGGLSESRFFDTVSTNNTRSLASIAAALQTKWNPNLSVGFARSVYSTATGFGQFPWRWFDVLSRTSASGDSTPEGTGTHKDQLFTLFARWVFPAEGIEIYSEWGRLRFNPSIRDLFLDPNDTQGYTLGLEWGGPKWKGGAFRLQIEGTQLEQSATFRDKPGPSWYSSKRVLQGYTNRGETLGASIGPGASSQWLAVDYIASHWRAGAFAGRIRWNEDVHGNAQLPIYVAYCSHDVSLYPGVRAGLLSRFGTLSADLSLQNRMNVFFQNDGGCPNIGQRLDIRNRTLSVSFTPFGAR